jgi:hypothetical protein
MVLRSIRLAILVTLSTFSSLQANESTTQWFKKSVITLTDPSEVPGMVIQPGTYVLKSEEGPGNGRTIIQLLNQDESQILTSFVAVPDHRPRPDYDTVITYFAVTDGPRPIQTWFYVGDMNGYEFVYPKTRAKEIAKHVDDHVMGAESKNASIVAITSNGTEVPIYEGTPKSSTSSGDVQREKPKAPPADNKTKRPHAKP